MTEEHAEAYARLRVRVTDLVRDVPADALERVAPATPEWRVQDVVAHMAGVADDIVCGRRDGIATDAWTSDQVDKRRSASLEDLLADWDRWAPEFEALLAAGPPEVTGQALFDSVTHEHDIRHAVDRPGARDDNAVAHAWTWFVMVRTLGGAPAIRFVTDYGDDVAGVGEPQMIVHASRFELVRATTGRRTQAEIEAYGWDPAPDAPILLAAPFFTMRTEPLGE